MKLVLLAVLFINACAAQIQLANTITCPSNVASVLAYLPPAGVPTGSTAKLVPTCVPIGTGLGIVAGKLNNTAPGVAVVPQYSHVDRFQMSALGPWPGDGSTVTRTLTLAQPMITGTAVIAFIRSATAIVDARVSVGTNALTTTIDPGQYFDPTAEIVVVYWSLNP